MHTMNWIEHDRFDPAQLHDRVRAELSPGWRERAKGLALVVPLFALTIAILIAGDFTPAVAFGGIFGGSGALYLMLKMRRERLATWARLADRPVAEMIAARRAELRARQQYARLAVLLPVALALGGLIARKLDLMYWLQVAAFVVLAIGMLFQARRDLRELRELGA